MSLFSDGELAWINWLGNLRNTIRQEVIRRQLAEHVEPPMTVLDVGCGQGTQAIALAKRGCRVTGMEPSAEMRELSRAEMAAAGVDFELLEGPIEALDAVVGDRQFDVVCAHGLLMYLDDRPAAIAALSDRIRGDGLLSLTFRNGHALAMRPGLRQQWSEALAAFDSVGYVNELGVKARADLLDDVIADLDAFGLDLVEWYGVRVFNDAAEPTAQVPSDEELVLLLDAEEQAGKRDPYRWTASQFHVVARQS